ncbi:transposase [candidate division WWE3 bacterium]|nr:transposase [candidate division WWE3 bacterium]
MPAKNSRKIYVENGIYHVYNRGVNGMPIFMDQHCMKAFLEILEWYLRPTTRRSVGKSFHDRIELYTFCLVENHLHLLLKQLSQKPDIAGFMKCIMSAFVMEVNTKHDRYGHLFQDRYKARLMTSEEDFLHTARYIHQNAWDARADLITYPFSSMKCYLDKKYDGFVKTDEIMGFFDYSVGSFVEFMKALPTTSSLID